MMRRNWSTVTDVLAVKPRRALLGSRKLRQAVASPDRFPASKSPTERTGRAALEVAHDENVAASSASLIEPFDEPRRTIEQTLKRFDAKPRTNASGSLPAARDATEPTTRRRTGFARCDGGLRPTGVPVKRQRHGVQNRFKSAACSWVNAVLSGATTLSIPRA